MKTTGPGLASRFPIWLLLIGILLIPSSVAIHLYGEGFKFTPGRAAITLLLLPALIKLLRKGRHLVFSDLLVLLTCAWMIGSRLQQDGVNDSAVAEAIELAGGYFVSRGYFFGRAALQDFFQVFRLMTIVLILLAVTESITGRNWPTAITSSLFHTPEFYPQFRYGIARAASTLEDAEHFGTFCCVAGSLCLFMVPAGSRFRWVGFCFFGCVLALSSGPLLGFAIMIATAIYDRLLKQMSWRWKALGAVWAGLISAVYVVAEHPTSWIITHLTIDPGTGYFRLYAFDYAFDQIALHPYVGWGFGLVGSDDFLSRISIDNVWLVFAIRFGLPAMILLLLTSVGTFFPLSSKRKRRDDYMDAAGTAFTCAIMSFVLIGLTVHFWNATWMLWSVCLGIRASIKECQIWHTNSAPVRNPQGPLDQIARRGPFDKDHVFCSKSFR